MLIRAHVRQIDSSKPFVGYGIEYLGQIHRGRRVARARLCL
jgi:hypothetical protein